MLGMGEINRMLKENFERQLGDVKDLPVDLARSYKQWVRGLMQQAAVDISNENNPAQESEKEGE